MTDNEVAQLIERIDSLRRELVLRSDTQEKALQIQAKEYERRLEALNHEAAQLKDMQAKYLPRETYEVDQRERVKQNDVTRATIISVMGILIAIAGVVINFLVR
jgi:phage host-nuclease inhibitor protein Gam